MMNNNPVAEQARKLQRKGVAGDTHLVHMNTREMHVLEQALGRPPNRNPHTGLPSFDEGEGSSGGQGDAAGGSGAGSSGAGTGGPSGKGGNDSGDNSGIGNAASANNPNTTSTGQVDHPGTTGNMSADNTDTGHSLSDGTVAGAISSASLGGFGAPTLGGFLDGLLDGAVASPVAAAVNAIASISPIAALNTGAKALTGINLGDVAQNLANGVAPFTGAVAENTAAGKIGAAISGLGGQGATTSADAAQGAKGGPDNAAGGSGGTSAQELATSAAAQTARAQADQAKAIADQAAIMAQQQPQLAPITPAQLSATFNQNTGNIFASLNNEALSSTPGLQDAFSKLTLPTSLDGLVASNAPPTGQQNNNNTPSSQNTFKVNINDLANPILALLSGSSSSSNA